MIQIHHLKKSFGEVEVLKDVSLKIQKGEVVAVIGPSGSGKSTFLRCINRLEEPTSGEIMIEGEKINDPACKIRKVRQGIGMVFQHFNLFMHFTVLKNVTYAPVHVKKKNKQEAEKEALELLELVGLKEKAGVYPITLSGGQKQRVAIARTLAMEPDIILFDEPTSALDPEMVNEVLEVIKGLAKTGITMVLVTHEMAFAKEVASRIVFLADGYLMEDTTPEEFFSNPKSQRAKDFLAKMI